MTDPDIPDEALRAARSAIEGCDGFLGEPYSEEGVRRAAAAAYRAGREDAATAIVESPAIHWAGSTLTAGNAVALASGDHVNPGRFFPAPPPPMCPACDIRHAPPIHYDAG